VTYELIERGRPLEMSSPCKILSKVMSRKVQITIQRVLTEIGEFCHERECFPMGSSVGRSGSVQDGNPRQYLDEVMPRQGTDQKGAGKRPERHSNLQTEAYVSLYDRIHRLLPVNAGYDLAPPFSVSEVALNAVYIQFGLNPLVGVAGSRWKRKSAG
jgi:hypothetical protein